MDVNFEYYKVFYYVGKYKNITKAAAAMKSNQPNVTRIIKLLEGELKCKLLIREARGVALTEEGRRLYSHVEIAFSQLQKAQEELCSQPLDGMGTVEIGATETALHLFLLEALSQFKETCKAVRIKIHNHTTPEILNNIAYGKLDFAVITTPFEIPRYLTSLELITFHEILVGGKEYRGLSEGVWPLDSLETCPWVGLGTGTATYEFYKDFFLKQHVHIEPDTEAATSDLLLPLIANNMGIGYVPEAMAAPMLRQGSLIRIHTGCEPPERKISLVFDKRKGQGRAADTLQQYLMSAGAYHSGKSGAEN